MYYWAACEEGWWDGDYVVYAPLTRWPSASDWMVPGTWAED